MEKTSRILAVDGSELSRTIISRILRNAIEGIEVITCATAEEALQLLSRQKFDLITTALVLPDMDGLDLSRRIRRSDNHRYTPVIVVSGDADSRLLREGFAAGVTDYFDKSQGYEALVEFIRDFMQRHCGLVGRILYVEDSRTAAAVNRQIMEKHGLQVTHTTTAEQALGLLENCKHEKRVSQEFDIVITDFFLKGKMTGGDLLHAIRTRLHMSQQEMPVLMITANNSDAAQIEAFHAGANDFVTKPIVEEIFMARIRSLLLIKQQYNALRNQAEEMCRLAVTDSLTGVRSKRYLLDHGEKFISDPRRQPAWAMLMDIDRFKQINDNLGHITGDHVLAALGSLLKRFFQNDAMVVRFGGEEFAVLLQNYSLEQVSAMAEALRVQVEHLHPANIDITISIGIASTGDGPGMDLTRLLVAADQALYVAKRSGRNRVCVYTNAGVVPVPATGQA